MKKTLYGFLCLSFLAACQTTGSLRPGDVMGTDIGSILSEEAGLYLGAADQTKMNNEIDKALFFSDDGLTTQWYAGTSARLRPLNDVTDRRDRECRRFRHGVMISSDWYNGTAVACREHNVAWYLIANRWDRTPARARDKRRDRDYLRDTEPRNGNWDNLADELSGNPSSNTFDDFGPRKGTGW